MSAKVRRAAIVASACVISLAFAQQSGAGGMFGNVIHGAGKIAGQAVKDAGNGLKAVGKVVHVTNNGGSGWHNGMRDDTIDDGQCSIPQEHTGGDEMLKPLAQGIAVSSTALLTPAKDLKPDENVGKPTIEKGDPNAHETVSSTKQCTGMDCPSAVDVPWGDLPFAHEIDNPDRWHPAESQETSEPID